MKLRRAIGTGIFTVLFGMSLVPVPAYAQATIQDARCTVAQGRIATYTTEIQALRETHLAAYQAILDKVEAIGTSSDENGYDTAKLTAAQTATQTAIDTYTTNATNFETALASLHEYACGESESQFTNALATARTTLTTLRTASETVKSSVLTDLVPEIEAYATWLGTQSNTTDTTTENQ